MAANVSKDHHYVPRGYLKRWATGTDGKLVAFFHHAKGLDCDRKTPAQTGYAPHLYTATLNPKFGDALEREFLSKVDDAASKLMDLFTSGDVIPPLNATQMNDWSRYLMTLMHRSPARMADLHEQLAETLKTVNPEITPELEADYATWKRPGDPATLAEYFASTRPRDVDLGAKKLLAILSNSLPIGTHINRMTKKVFNLKGTKHELLTSDQPLIVSGGLGRTDAFLMMALSPHRLFVATNTDERMSSLASHIESGLLTKENNASVCQNAERFVYGTDFSQTSFVRKYFRPR